MDIPLYKVWDFYENKWVAPIPEHWCLNQYGRLVECGDECLDELDERRYKVVWWSGKKDKNGEPLYCNDMVRSPLGKLPWYIFVQDGQFMRRAVYDGELIAPIDYSEEDLVKVGSLYEHPEMKEFRQLMVKLTPDEVRTKGEELARLQGEIEDLGGIAMELPEVFKHANLMSTEDLARTLFYLLGFMSGSDKATWDRFCDGLKASPYWPEGVQ